MKTAALLLLTVVYSAVFSVAFSHSVPRFQRWNIESRIVGGEQIESTDAPYIVSLSVSSINYAHFCAGSIISKDWILTAAHCLQDLKDLGGDPIGMAVYAGLRNRTHLDVAQVRHTDFAFAHKKFTGQEGSDDIALLHVSSSFEINARVKPVVLPTMNEEYVGESKTYGWGLRQVEESKYEKQLQMGVADVLNATECRAALPAGAPVNKRHVCVRVAACHGDGGTPLVVERVGGVSELIGIGSYGYMPCGYRGFPTVYTAVGNYVDWIALVEWTYYTLH